jgi:hypothetical protein
MIILTLNEVIALACVSVILVILICSWAFNRKN